MTSLAPGQASSTVGPRAEPGTAGSQFHGSPAVEAAVRAIVAEARAASSRITEVRGPSAELKVAYDDLLRRAGEVRGRGLLYPYLGSGLGNGALVELADGSVKWDMICGIGVHFFGHSDADMMEHALRGALSDTGMAGNLQSNFDHYALGEALLSQARRSSRLAHVYLSTSGAMANENGLKVCYQKHAPASRVLAFKDCFMGRTVTMSQIGDAAGNRVGIPLSTLVDYMPFYDHGAAERMGRGRYIDMCVWHLNQYIERYPKQHACFIFELVQGEGGFNTAPREYFTALMDVCKANGIAVWDDEVQSFGRTESMMAYEALNLGEYVDVLCVGKMTQVCATLFTKEYNPGPGLLSGTFTGSGPSFAVGRRVVERLAGGRDGQSYYGPEGLIARHHRAFVEQVRALAAAHPEWFPRTTAKWGPLHDVAGGTGGMMRFTPFGGDKDKVNKACKSLYDEHVIAFYCGHGPYHVRMLPPLGVMDERDWPRVFECVRRGLARAAQG